MSKYWQKPDEGLDRSQPMKPWAQWHTDHTFPKQGQTFAARICGSNRVIAGRYNALELKVFQVVNGRDADEITVHQWLTWEELGEIQQCAWRKM